MERERKRERSKDNKIGNKRSLLSHSTLSTGYPCAQAHAHKRTDRAEWDSDSVANIFERRKARLDKKWAEKKLKNIKLHMFLNDRIIDMRITYLDRI